MQCCIMNESNAREMSQKFTKIVATVGPASTSPEVLEGLIREGVNVIRLNFSHGDYAIHAATVEKVKAIDAKLGTHTALLADMQGPKLRVGMMEDGAELVNGNQLTIKVGEGTGNAEVAWTRYEKFAADVKAEEPVLLDDGKLRLRVDETNGVDTVVCTVEHGGILHSRKGLNLPSTAISLPSLTEKDREDLAFALSIGVDWIGLSFVRSSADVIDLRERIQQAGSHARIVAKVEKPEAVDDLEGIVKATDSVMIARGDLGVEVPMEQVPMIQKRTIELCQREGKPVIVATQMMESMVDNIAPTRAEVTDVANAVFDGADAVMLSGETSVGKHPIEVIKAMRAIVTEIEKEPRIYYTHREQAGHPARAARDGRHLLQRLRVGPAGRRPGHCDHDVQWIHRLQGGQPAAQCADPCVHGQQEHPWPARPVLGCGRPPLRQDDFHGPHHFGRQVHPSTRKGLSGTGTASSTWPACPSRRRACPTW